MPLVRDRQPSKGCLRAPLRASRSNRNNIPYIAPPFLQSAPNRYHLTVKGDYQGLFSKEVWKGVGILIYIIYLSNPLL